MFAPGASIAGDVFVTPRQDDDASALFHNRLGREPDHVVGASPIDPAAPVRLLGVSLDACSVESPLGEGLGEAVESVEGAINYAEFERAEDLLATAWRALPCLQAPVEPEELARLHFFQGLTSYYRGNPERSREDFRRGLLVSSVLQWDPTYPPDAHPVFLEALRATLTAGEGILQLSPGLEGAEVRLNGVVLDARSRSRPLVAGRHVVQVRGGGLQTFVFDLPAGAAIELLTEAELQHALARPDAVGPLARRARAAEIAARVGEEEPHIWVERQAELLVVDRYEAAADRWVRVNSSQVFQRVRRSRSVQGAGVALLIGGAVSSGVGLGLVIDSKLRADAIGADIDGTAGERATAAHSANLDALYAQYPALQQQWRVGVALGAGGLGLVVGGIIPLHVGTVGARGRQLTSDWKE